MRDLRGMKRSRRSSRQIHIQICRAFRGSAGLETRDLRRDRPRRPSQRATHGNGFRLFSRFCARTICHRSPTIATSGLHKGSIVRRQSRQRPLARRSTGRARMPRSTVGAGAKTIPNTNLTKTRVASRGRRKAPSRGLIFSDLAFASGGGSAAGAGRTSFDRRWR